VSERDQPVISSLDELVAHVRALRQPGARTLVGIAGPPGAGKSRLARFVASQFTPGQAAIVEQDGFHLANDVLAALGRRDRKGAPDTFDAVGLVHLLDRLRQGAGDVVYAPVFRREIEEAINAAVPIDRDVEVVVVEGNYLLVDDGPWRGVAARLDRTLYVDAPEEARTRRLLDRARATYGPAGPDWVERVDRPNARLVEATRHRADAIVRRVDVPSVRDAVRSRADRRGDQS
jgi:pantothenate kinase